MRFTQLNKFFIFLCGPYKIIRYYKHQHTSKTYRTTNVEFQIHRRIHTIKQ